MAAFIADAGLIARTREGARMMIFENPKALPRAFVVYRTRSAPPLSTVTRERDALGAPLLDARP